MKSMHTHRPLLLALGLALPLGAMAQSEFTTLEQRAGYGIGISIGSNLAGQGLTGDIDLPALLQGIQDGVAGELKMSEEEVMAAIQEFTALQEGKAQALMDQQAEAGRTFLADNATREGVMTTASGLQYQVISEGAAGGSSPAETDTVNVHYHGTLIDGTVFDSSVDRGQPITFPLNGVIPGWTEGLQLMSVGDKYRFFIPSELAYGTNGAGPIAPNSTLIFDVELLGIEE